MSTRDQARALMMRQRHQVKNRQQSMLSRSAEEIGLDPEAIQNHSPIQDKPLGSLRNE